MAIDLHNLNDGLTLADLRHHLTQDEAMWALCQQGRGVINFRDYKTLEALIEKARKAKEQANEGK